MDMELYQELREKARKNINIADHMIYMTYNVVKDPKLLLTIMDNIFLSLTYGMSSLLHYERMYKKVAAFPENFESKLELFKERVAPKYGIPLENIKMMQKVKDIILEHKRSPMEFVRGNKFVICNDSYKMRTLSVDEIKEYIKKTKEFLEQTEAVTKKNERLLV